MWLVYQIIFRLRSPLHIGWGMAIIKLPGPGIIKTIFAAVSSAVTRGRPLPPYGWLRPWLTEVDSDDAWDEAVARAKTGLRRSMQAKEEAR